MKKKINALVPMKGHSERVPGKNLNGFCGRPLFRSVMDALSKAASIGTIAVDTDSAEIKKAVSKYYMDVVIIDRPKEICGDHVPMNDVIRHDLSRIEGEHFLQTHSTNPLLKAGTIDRAVEKYFEVLNKGYDSLFSVIRHQSRFYDKAGRAVNHDPARLIRTQDLDPVYEESSTFYIFSREVFSRQGRRIGAKPFLYEISKIEAIDIDEEEDFKTAAALFRIKESL